MIGKSIINSRIYLDYASLTPIDNRILREINRYSSHYYANPSSWYKEGVFAMNALALARNSVARCIHSHPDEIFFTSGGTESNNLAILGVVNCALERGLNYSEMNVIISSIEHSSIIKLSEYLKGLGIRIKVVPVDVNGIVNINELKKLIDKDTLIVSIMTVNNEIGSIQPIKEISKLIRHARGHDDKEGIYPLFHTDASQALLFADIDMEKNGIDLMTMDGGKICGPRGVGALYIKRKTPISSILFGGGQESGMRSGTENIPSIMGFAKAIEIAVLERNSEVQRLTELRASFIVGLKNIKTGIKINPEVSEHDVTKFSPHILNISIPGIDNEFFIFQLDAAGVACSTKSSCLRDEDESFVLKSIGADSKNSIRFSFGRWTRMRDIKKTLRIIKILVKSL